MTAREKRLIRLVTLRERQHDVAALHLRSARGLVVAAENAMAEAQERTRTAQLCRLLPTVGDDAKDWQIAGAEVNLGVLAATRYRAELAGARAVEEHAAKAETAARQSRKQMDATLATATRAGAQHARRLEQRTLDEIARLQRAAMGRSSFS